MLRQTQQEQLIMKKLLIIVFIFLGLFSSIALVQTTRHKSLRDGLRPVQFAPTQQTTEVLSENSVKSNEVKVSSPAYLSIKKLSLSHIPIEHVGLDKEGKMDVPKNADNVAWFKPGYLPGTNGNSVLAGHFDKESGAPAVFYNLNKLIPGDEIEVEGEDGDVKIFVVTDKQLLPNDNFPVQEVFGKSDKKMLNLITCDGTWDPVKKSYSDRLVVFTELKE